MPKRGSTSARKSSANFEIVSGVGPMAEGRPPKREEILGSRLPHGRTTDGRTYQKQPLVQAWARPTCTMEMTKEVWLQ